MRCPIRERIELPISDPPSIVENERVSAPLRDLRAERLEQPAHSHPRMRPTHASVPQSARSTAPVIAGTSSDARNAIAFATSSGFDIECGTGGEM